VRRGNKWDAKPAEQGQVQPVNMSVDHIKFAGVLSHRFEQRRLRRHGIGARPAKPK
jgi:hypothetical protein